MDLDEDALLCDFAETYHIYDIYQHPCEYIATLAVGLRDDSRIMMKLKGLRVSPELLALSCAADSLRTYIWAKTKDGKKGRNRPASILELMETISGGGKKETQDVRGFESGEDFMEAWNRLSKEGV